MTTDTSGPQGAAALRDAPPPQYSPADIGALAHLYRGEMYQSKIWRGRLDATTNWAVVITGIALSVTFANTEASPIPMLLVSWLVVAFLAFEARRYRFYDLFRVRVRVLEINFYGPMLRGEGVRVDNGWNHLLADDYLRLRFHISYLEALGRRIRRNYGWLFATQLGCYAGKLIVHPTPLASLDQLWERAAIGPIPGKVALAIGVVFHLSWIAVALITLRKQEAVGLPKPRAGKDPLIDVAGREP